MNIISGKLGVLSGLLAVASKGYIKEKDIKFGECILLVCCFELMGT